MGIADTLKRTEVFLGLDDSDLDKIAALPSCREASYQPGDVIIRAGDEAENLYVIKDGQVDVVMKVSTKSEPAEKVVIDVITKGGFFGWSALVRPHFYTMSAICRKPATVASISGAELLALFDKDYHIGYRVYQSLARIVGTRLRDLEQVMVRGERWPFVERRTTL